MSKQNFVPRFKQNIKKLRIFNQDVQRKIGLTIEASPQNKAHKFNTMHNYPDLSKQHNKDFKNIKQQISTMKKQLGEFLQQKKTQNKLEHLEHQTGSPKSPTSLLQYFPPELINAENDNKNSSFSSNESQQNFYKTKFNLLSEQFQSTKRNYLMKKLRYKQTIHKLEKRVYSLENIIKSNEIDLEEYKNILGNQITLIKNQINNCTQSQIITKGSYQNQAKGLSFLSEQKLNYSLVLDPTYQSIEYTQLKEIVEEKQDELNQCLQNIQKIKLENLHLEDLLESKQKQQLQYQELKEEHSRQKFVLNQIINKLKEEKQSNERYKEELFGLSSALELEQRRAIEEEAYLRNELENSLLRLSSLQTQAREIQTQRQCLYQQKLTQILNQLAEKDTRIFELEAQLRTTQSLGKQPDEKRLFINISKQDFCPFTEPSSYQLIQSQNDHLIHQLSSVTNLLSSSSLLIQQHQSKYEEQLYNQQISMRKRHLQFQDKLLYYMSMVNNEVSDPILRQQDLQLLQKQHQIQRLNLILTESQNKIYSLQRQVIRTNQLTIINNRFYQQQVNNQLIYHRCKNRKYEEIIKQLKQEIIEYKSSGEKKIIGSISQKQLNPQKQILQKEDEGIQRLVNSSLRNSLNNCLKRLKNIKQQKSRDLGSN